MAACSKAKETKNMMTNMAKKLRNIVMMMTHEDANDYIIPKGE